MIKQLSTELINLISAGEVVERPLSVVKELVENSLDAKSSKIIIELESSGLKKIIVTDNGIGISKEELPLALLPHSTSKLLTKNDLFSISTLGFRGEALPSIAQVSIFKITSKKVEEDCGSFIKVEGGKTVDSGVTSAKDGTKVEVANLFFNTPARYKHLSSEQNELSLIITLITRFALANENVSFTLINNQKTLFNSLGDGLSINLLSECFGNDASKNMFEFNDQTSMYKISGFSTNNNTFRSNKNAINIFCNNRIIRNLSIQYAITDAYQSIIPIGKYPITVLKIECDSELVDVNIHPSKMEIKFTDESSLRESITKILRKAIYEKPLIYQAKEKDIEGTVSPVVQKPAIEYDTNVSFDDVWDSFKNAEVNISSEEESSIQNDLDMLNNFTADTPNSSYSSYQETIDSFINNPQVLNEDEEISYDESDSEISDNTDFSFKTLRYIGQYNETYLLLENDTDLFLIDQHAAMERCMYERISKELEQSTHECFELLIPFNLDFLASDVELINSKQEELLKQGIIMDHFGGTTFVVRQVPAWIPTGLEVEFISDIVNHIVTDRNVNKHIMYESLAKQLACKKSIKANMRITDNEVEAVLNDLSICNMPYTCPHGRPTLVKITKYEIEKMFKRVI